MLFVVVYPLVMLLKLSKTNTQNPKFEKLYNEFFTIYEPYFRYQFSFSCLDIIRKLVVSVALVYLHDEPN